MSDIQFKNKHTNRNEVSMDGLYATSYFNSAESIWREVDEKFKAWEIRRGFTSEEEQAKGIRGLRGRSFLYGKLKENQEKASKAKPQKKKVVKKILKKTAKKSVKKKIIRRKK